MTSRDQPLPFPVDFVEELARNLPPEISLPSPDRVAAMEMHARLLLQWNERFNLTAITEPREIVRRHFAESLFALPWMAFDGRLLDLGTGAGFPGLPIHMARDRGYLILVESSRKKVEFLETVIRMTGVEGVNILNRHVRKSNDLADVGQFDTMVLRAVKEPERKVRLLQTLLRPGGRSLLFIGQRAADMVADVADDIGLQTMCKRLLPGARASYLVVLSRPLT